MKKTDDTEDLVVTRYPVSAPCPHFVATAGDEWCRLKCEAFIEENEGSIVCQHHRCPVCHGTCRVTFDNISGHDYETDCRSCSGRGLV